MRQQSKLEAISNHSWEYMKTRILAKHKYSSRHQLVA